MKNFRRGIRLTYWILGIVCLLGIISCDQREPDRSFLQGDSCTPPCWQNITPGLTTLNDGEKNLLESSLILQDSLSCKPSDLDINIVSCGFRRTSQEGGGVLFEKGITSGIQLQTNNLTLEEVIVTLGPPDYVATIHARQNTIDGKCYRMDAFYLRGIYLFISNCEPLDSPITILFDDNSLLVFPEMLVNGVDFFSPANDLNELLTYRYSSSEAVDNVLSTAVPWSGYGGYAFSTDD